MAQRFAIHFAPVVTHPLWQRAARWLGRDAATGQTFSDPIDHLSRDRLSALTVSACRYGFHATLKAPMALPSDEDEDTLMATLDAFAGQHGPVPLGQLRLELHHGFLALVPAQPNEALQDLAAHVVESFEPFRAPLSIKDRARQVGTGLTPRQEELLDGYGYPYVFEEFQFHMTLTGPLGEADRHPVLAAAQSWFAPVLGTPVVLDRLALFVEPAPGEPFRRVADYPLLGGLPGFP
ncbi:MAG: hypothetical protein JWR39_1951 [Devosia sp.]|nr:hypothetical protein [Devosia sp.]